MKSRLVAEKSANLTRLGVVSREAVVQLTGGNDGLNTVIPYADDLYQKNRFATRITEDRVHRIDDYVGLHPSLTGLSELLEEERLAIVQGVGYPNPNRSHFESMDIWHTAVQTPSTTSRQSGWLGRYLDASPKDTAAPADVPADAVTYYADLLEKVSKTPEWQEFVTRTAQTGKFMKGKELADFVAKDEAANKKVFENEGWVAK